MEKKHTWKLTYECMNEISINLYELHVWPYLVSKQVQYSINRFWLQQQQQQQRLRRRQLGHTWKSKLNSFNNANRSVNVYLKISVKIMSSTGIVHTNCLFCFVSLLPEVHAQFAEKSAFSMWRQQVKYDFRGHLSATFFPFIFPENWIGWRVTFGVRNSTNSRQIVRQLQAIHNFGPFLDWIDILWRTVIPIVQSTLRQLEN